MHVGTYLLPHFVCFDSSAAALLRAVVLMTPINAGPLSWLDQTGTAVAASQTPLRSL